MDKYIFKRLGEDKNFRLFKKNAHRPVIIQELSTSVNASSIYEYISMSDKNDADYLSSGVCSQQAIKAISAGVKTPMSSIGLNIPSAVYGVVKSSGHVSKTSYFFPDEGKGISQHISGANMWVYYPEANLIRIKLIIQAF